MDAANNLVLRTGYVNIYRSGFFHRIGKPGCYDRHPGDIYDSYETALADVELVTHYIGTVQLAWYDVPELAVNPPESKPVSLGWTRKLFNKLGKVFTQDTGGLPPEVQLLLATSMIV